MGCVPTKMYVYPADIARRRPAPSRLGIDATLDKVRWRDIRDRDLRPDRPDLASTAATTARTAARTSALYDGHARFTGPKQHRRGARAGATFTADRIVIATGGPPVRSPSAPSTCRTTPRTRSCASTTCPSGS